MKWSCDSFLEYKISNLKLCNLITIKKLPILTTFHEIPCVLTSYNFEQIFYVVVERKIAVINQYYADLIIALLLSRWSCFCLPSPPHQYLMKTLSLWSSKAKGRFSSVTIDLCNWKKVKSERATLGIEQ